MKQKFIKASLWSVLYVFRTIYLLLLGGLNKNE